ncbi:GlyGly-CTERM sorting domain-containing protein [Photobacterium sp. GB-36]|uniref:GlyGly-CTERM sorting domain-containing protein n=1 Tax=Photobacterium sp. GB-36 TaxID=2022108 RepID=UPI000D1637A7|nr:GlyGly-CTERM sorting domain-containing protein [Photobacterium sp. GB-36]PSV42504.1 hypothetical protein C9J46_14355 [Photobacterium sp. GB-36]
MPTVVEVNDIGKDYNITVQNLTVNNITLNSDSDCNRLIKPFDVCQLSFSVNDGKSGAIELGKAGNSLKIKVVNKFDDLIPYDKKKDDLIPYDDDNNDNNNGGGGGGGSLNFMALFLLFGTALLRKR